MKKTNKKPTKEISRKEVIGLINFSQDIVNIAKAEFNKQKMLPHEYESKLRRIIEGAKMCFNKFTLIFRYNTEVSFLLEDLILAENIIDALTMEGDLKTATKLYIQLSKTNLFKMDVVKHLKDNKLI